MEITLSHVTKRYLGETALDDVSLTFRQGEIVCILGESGAGKTTLLQAVSSLIETEGKIEGVPTLSYIFQTPRLIENLTVRENLEFVLPKEQRKCISETLRLLSLSEKENAYPSTLSGGQAGRVAIARAFLYPSEAILMDEPFSSLDLSLKIRLISLFRDLWKREKRTVLYVTHDVEEAILLAHRIVILKKGRVIADLQAGVSDSKAQDELRRRVTEYLLG
ncbi:MAG: ABC transporter ATP-binding protein [Clostridia bacterium]|nr:ABC transporter ATP-binding protein [Clostridia bacterium]